MILINVRLELIRVMLKLLVMILTMDSVANVTPASPVTVLVVLISMNALTVNLIVISMPYVEIIQVALLVNVKMGMSVMVEIATTSMSVR